MKEYKYELFFNRALKKWSVHFNKNNGKYSKFFSVSSKENGIKAINYLENESGAICKAMTSLQAGCGKCAKCQFGEHEIRRVLD